MWGLNANACESEILLCVLQSEYIKPREINNVVNKFVIEVYVAKVNVDACWIFIYNTVYIYMCRSCMCDENAFICQKPILNSLFSFHFVFFVKLSLLVSCFLFVWNNNKKGIFVFVIIKLPVLIVAAVVQIFCVYQAKFTQQISVYLLL